MNPQPFALRYKHNHSTEWHTSIDCASYVRLLFLNPIKSWCESPIGHRLTIITQTLDRIRLCQIILRWNGSTWQAKTIICNSHSFRDEQWRTSQYSTWTNQHLKSADLRPINLQSCRLGTNLLAPQECRFVTPTKKEQIVCILRLGPVLGLGRVIILRSNMKVQCILHLQYLYTNIDFRWHQDNFYKKNYLQ